MSTPLITVKCEWPEIFFPRITIINEIWKTKIQTSKTTITNIIEEQSFVINKIQTDLTNKFCIPRITLANEFEKNNKKLGIPKITTNSMIDDYK